MSFVRNLGELSKEQQVWLLEVFGCVLDGVLFFFVILVMCKIGDA